MEFKHLEYFYFHNFIYESVWKDNHRRHTERFPIRDVFNRYGRDYKVIFVGDASISPWELVYPGGSVEHNNSESGEVWMQRVMETYDRVAWLNPVDQQYWEYTQSIGMVSAYIDDKMFPLTLKGLEQATKWLAH